MVHATELLTGEPLQIWNDWGAGVGWLTDDGRTNGMYYSTGILGLPGELRPAPSIQTAGANDVESNTIGVRPTFTPSSSTLMGEAIITLQPDIPQTIAISTATTSSITANTVLTYAVTVGAGSNKVLVVVVHTSGAATSTTVTFNGVAMTIAATSNTGASNANTYIFIQAQGAATTTANVVITLGAARDIYSGAMTATNVDQSSVLLAKTGDTVTSTVISITVPYLRTYGALIAAVTATSAVTMTAAGGFTASQYNATVGATIRAACAVITGVPTMVVPYTPQYYFEEPVSTNPAKAYLYAMRGLHEVTTVANQNATCFLEKISLNFADFGEVMRGMHKTGPDADAGSGKVLPGQPARHKGVWFIPGGIEATNFKLTTVGDGDVDTDVLSFGPDPADNTEADHLAQLGFQLALASHKDAAASYTVEPGCSILKPDGSPIVNADWGPSFYAGNSFQRPLGLATLGRLVFVYGKDGLYSFNEEARAGLVFEDIRTWRPPGNNASIISWREGLLIGHPTGILFYIAGQQPIPIGPEARPDMKIIPVSETEFHSGRYYGITTAGDFIYALRQVTPSSASVEIMCGYPRSDDTTDLIWQVIGVTSISTLSPNQFTGCFVTQYSQPQSAAYTTPVLWFGTNTAQEIGYMVLDKRGGPFRPRVDTQTVPSGAIATLSELWFDDPVDLTNLVIYTQDMSETAVDEWRMQLSINGDTAFARVGVISQNGRIIIKLGNTLPRVGVYRLQLQIQFITSDTTTARVPPSIKRIELWGNKTYGERL